jgi:pyridinium-3,5-biscarboxylic acid mononucleotide synthase
MLRKNLVLFDDIVAEGLAHKVVGDQVIEGSAVAGGFGGEPGALGGENVVGIAAGTSLRLPLQGCRGDDKNYGEEKDLCILHVLSECGIAHCAAKALTALDTGIAMRVPLESRFSAAGRGARGGDRMRAMNENDVRNLLELVKQGRLSTDAAVERLRQLPYEDLGFAKIDHHRALRQGYPEVVFARGKTPKQVVEIVRGMLRAKASHNVLITRADKKIYAGLKKLSRAAEFHELSGAIVIVRERTPRGKGLILVVSAGTSDIPVAEEALVTARAMGNRAEAVYDVGVAGLHRLLEHRQKLAEARVIICVAGMEGALPSVVAGMVSAPVIAVPTSTGYGSSFGGLTALLAMLNSCASNVSVVNIDNGFGAGCVASVINRL